MKNFVLWQSYYLLTLEDIIYNPQASWQERCDALAIAMFLVEVIESDPILIN